MLKREKEVYGYLLDTEEAVMKELEEQYRKALEDINTCIMVMQADELTQSKVYRIEYQNTLKKQVEAILEKLHSDEFTSMQQYLSGTYTDAYVGTVYALHGQGVPVLMPIDQKAAVKAVLTDSKINTDLYTHLGVDITKLKKAIRNEITRGIASGMLYQDIARNVSFTTGTPLNRAKNIVQTEGHRIQQSSAHDARHHAISRGADLVKQWDATLDGATRDTHRKLDGQIREVDEPFEMDGKEAQYPGDFNDPAEDCRCRCVALSRARSALDATELETMKERAKFFNLDKTKDFEDFKGKYLKAAEETAEKAPALPPTIHPVKPATPPQPVQTSEPDQQTEHAFGKPAARSGVIDDVLSPEMAAAYDARMKDAPESVRNAHDKYRDRIVFADAESKEHPHYALAEGGITTDLQRDLARDNGYAVFHEIGHNVDNNMHIDNTFTGSGKWGGDTQYGYSYTYGKNKFGKAIASDADKALEDYRLGIVKQHEDAEREARRTYDGSKTRSFLEMMGLSGDELETEMELDYRDHVRKTKAAAGLFGDPPSNRKDIEYGFARHISDTLSRSARRDISDMFESTFQYADHPFGAGHGLDYWKQEEFLRPTEAFAEMYGASIASPESWEQIKRFFPSAVKVFEEMLE